MESIIQGMSSSPQSREDLTPLLAPRSIVVLGASPRLGSLGNTTVRNLVDAGFRGTIHPVHPTASEVCGLPASRDLSSMQEPVDCAVVCLSADKVVSALEEASAKGVRAAVVFASGFGETGPEGAERQRQLIELGARTGMRICGPNCLGLANVAAKIPLYSAALPETLASGDVAVLSHSGSGCIALSSTGRFGISYLVSIGNGAVVDVDALLDHLADDPTTRVAALFIESIRDPAAFRAAALRMRQAGKKIVALKVGRSERGASATAAHTGSLAGKAAVYDDFFASCGVISVEDLDEMVETIELVRCLGELGAGSGVAITAVSGGEIALTCDIAESVGLPLASLGESTKPRLAALLPSFGHATNPLDVTGVGVFDMALYRGALAALADDPAVALVMVSLDCPSGLGTEQAETYRHIARMVVDAAPALPKPVIFYSNMAGGLHPHVVEPLVQAGIPVMQGARSTLLAVSRVLAARGQAHSETGPALARSTSWHDRLGTGAPLTERKAKLFLADAGVPVTREALARTAEEAVAIASGLGGPVVLKIESIDLPHKTDVGGVRLGLRSAEEVRSAFEGIILDVRRLAPAARIEGVLVQEMVASGVEVIVGLTRQEPFGMAVVVGAGGVLVELIDDAAVALAPVSPSRAMQLIEKTKVHKLLQGHRGSPPADIAALATLVSTLSRLSETYGDVLEAIDLNPVSVLPAGQGVRILDAFIQPRAAVTAATGEKA